MKTKVRLIYARKGILKDGTGLVQIEVYFGGGIRRYISTGVYITPDQWDKNKIKPLTSDLIRSQRLIDKQLAGLSDFEYELIRGGAAMTPELLDEYVKGKSTDFIIFMKDEIRNNLTTQENTKRVHNYALNLLTEYKSQIPFSSLDFNFVQAFDTFLRKKGLMEGTIEGTHKRIKRYLHLAINKGLLAKSPYKQFTIKRSISDRTSLTEEDIALIENYDTLDNAKHSFIKDLFLFMVYSGLRYSDLMALQPKHIVQGENGLEIELGRMVKVPFPVFIPLGDVFDGKGEAILKRYMANNEEYIFPRLSNQKFNQFMKELAYLAKVTKPCSCLNPL